MRNIIAILAFAQIALFALGACDMLVAHETDKEATCKTEPGEIVGIQSCDTIPEHWVWGPK